VNGYIKHKKVRAVRMHGGLMMNNIQHPTGLILWCALSEEYLILCVFTEGAADSDVHLTTLRGEFVCSMMGYCSVVHRFWFQHKRRSTLH